MVFCSMATEEDLPYIVSLEEKNRESVGHLPKPALRERIGRGTVALGTLNGWPFGYLLYDYRSGICKIHQACIQYDARRKTYGAALLWWTLDRLDGLLRCDLRCAADLEANLFWREMGFGTVAVVDGGVRRGRKLNLWRRWFAVPLVDEDWIVPLAQVRQDAMYDDSGFLRETPEGFDAGGVLDKVAWRKYK